ncbi:aminodeoxychorismate lyase [Mycobacterium sp. CBMA247]|nr:aminodeoxychorismate lyase [Mycolicibacterium sp. CBMA 329]MUL90096.1 aminodeoxychorismate lyase [Mycolicibacterium sp. CBMA 331]MUL97884.1 aminodeoxychorismate lyase [Mycolicibacterium sp. CBMA 334]MUM29723.1 aminodeoxychorismate lyase [Mycolicibacterium sp. CBMA 295]MUM39611.1 aminodeoxychorismate lyase [Mycolicibacterium sp. CBMA 247]MUM46697.1 aminodeoxychorismate lyase [Mycolicibacterium sp. CBMA 294]
MLVTLDGQIHDPNAPLLHADDLATVRGDGIFETLLVRDGRPCLLEAHLARLRQSAKMLDLPEPDLDAWRAAVALGADRWASEHDGEGVLRLVYSRGRESGGPASVPTAFATIGELADRVAGVRRDGLAAITLDRGLPLGARDMPWLAAGAKTLSYAVNMAALRHAERQGAGDVIFVSSDGYVLEGPRSTVVIATEGPDGQPLLLTPPPWYPILRGTTQRALFEVARNKGYDCDFRALKPADLLTAQGIWLLSSIALAARVHTLDGQRLPDASQAVDVAGLVEAAIICDR